MNIFIDESGSFVNAPNRGSFNTIAAYLSPESDRRRIQKILWGMKRSVGMTTNLELKLKALDESKYFSFIDQLCHLDGILFAVATDAGLNHPDDVAEHQRRQADKIIYHKDKMKYQAAKEGLQSLSDRVASLPQQLYVQLHCQVNLIEAIVRNGVLYYVQRFPRHLGHFRWRIDQKNSTKTEYETAFTNVTPAFLQTMSLREPMAMLKGADYSAFSRFDFPADEKPTYLRDSYGIESSDHAATNIGMLLRENIQFVDSQEYEGVQVADLLASGLRRCLRENFSDNSTAAELLGRLMVKNYKGQPPIQLLSFGKTDVPVTATVAKLVATMKSHCRAMLV